MLSRLLQILLPLQEILRTEPNASKRFKNSAQISQTQEPLYFAGRRCAGTPSKDSQLTRTLCAALGISVVRNQRSEVMLEFPSTNRGAEVRTLFRYAAVRRGISQHVNNQRLIHAPSTSFTLLFPYLLCLFKREPRSAIRAFALLGISSLTTS